MVFLLSKRGYTVNQLAKRFKACTKTIRRDLVFMQASGVPVFNELVYDDESDWDKGRQITAYRVDPKWLLQFNKK